MGQDLKSRSWSFSTAEKLENLEKAWKNTKNFIQSHLAIGLGNLMRNAGFVNYDKRTLQKYSKHQPERKFHY